MRVALKSPSDSYQMMTISEGSAKKSSWKKPGYKYWAKSSTFYKFTTTKPLAFKLLYYHRISREILFNSRRHN
jgi:hypothetical protein